MENLLEISEPEVRINFVLNTKCRCNLLLRSLCPSFPVAFKVQTSSPHKFLVNPPSGLVPPSSHIALQIILKPQAQIPPTFPRSQSDRFLIRTARFDLDSYGSTQSNSVNSWLSTRPTHDIKLKVAFVGPFLLQHAVSCGDFEAVKNMIKRQKSVLYDLSTKEAESLLRVATQLDNNSEDMVNLLLEAGLRIGAREEEEHYANHNDNNVGVYQMDPQWESKGWNEVHVSVAYDRSTELVELLKKGGRETLDWRDKDGRTPLLLAATKGNIECARMLLESGVDKNAKSNDGRTALHRALANGNRRMVEMLIEMDADPTISDDRGRSALDFARDKGHEEMVRIMERGEEVLVAARCGDKRRLQSLLKNGAAMNFVTVAAELDATKQELNKIRQDFDAALETKLTAFQQAAEAQLSAKVHSERVRELSKEISAMKEAIKQVKFATQQVYHEQENIAAEKDVLQKSYESAKEEAEQKLISSRKAYDPELTKYLEGKLMETTAEVEALQEEMRKVHALEMDSVRVLTAELNEATTTLQLVADEECSLRTLVSSVRLELEEVKKRKQQTELKDKEAETAEQNVTTDHNFRLQQLLSEIENATSEAQEMKKSTKKLKIEAEAAQIAVKEFKQKLQLALEQAEEAKAAERKALDQMRVLSVKTGTDNAESSGKIKISMEEFESLKRKVDEYGTVSEKKIAAAMAELEAINASKNETDEKLEANLKAIKEIKAATELAEKSAMMAETAQSVIEGELRRRRQQEEVVA